MTTICDSLSPAELDMIHKAFGFDLDDWSYDGEFLTDEQADQMVGLKDASHLWHSLWLFGIVLDDDKDYYRNPDSEGWSMNIDHQLGWYIPDDYDTTVPLLWEELA
jgi:hypothetical protein